VSGAAGFGATGVLSGYVRLAAGDSAIEFGSGQITSLAKGAHLGLNGTDAFIEDSTAPGSNSALTGLALISAGASFALHDQAAVSTTGALVNDGNVYLDRLGGNGGSSLTLAGALTNSHDLVIGNATLSASDKVAATSLDNKGSINLTGSGANQALLDVTAGSAGFGAAGVLSGSVQLSGDSAIEFASGEITSLPASAQLALLGNSAFIEDSKALGSNSALTGLANVAGNLFLENGASVSTTGALVVSDIGGAANEGNILLDSSDTGDRGGSSLTVGGTLTITSNADLVVDAYPSLAPDKVTAAALDNTGLIVLFDQSLLDVTTGVAGFGTAGTVTGNVGVYDSSIEFLSGQISTIAASFALELRGNNGFVEDSTALGSNSALTGLADIAGSLYLETGCSVSTTGSVTNSGFLGVDYQYNYSLGGSTLSIGGALTNTGMLEIGNSTRSFDSVTAKSFVNSGTVDLTSNGANLAALDVSGETTNSGAISIASYTEELAGAVGGTGSFSLSTANLQFDSSVSAGQTITETGADELTLKLAQSFLATISGFGTGDTIDATNFHAPPATTFNFLENSAMTGGTLTLTDGV
jgi:hypothetical protein